MNRRTLVCALYAGVALLHCGCAKQGFPPGGPEDRTPPEVTTSEPASGSIEVGLRTPIVVTFSEPMQRDEVEKALNIFPATAGGLNLHWQGTGLWISPDTAWAADQTYILILQADARDAHNNRLARSLQIAFSTGAAIDSGVVSGRIVKDGRPAAGATALLFRISDGHADPEQDTADYVVTADSSGGFAFGYLGPGSYRVFGLDDRDRDWLWNVGIEAIAVPALDAHLVRTQDTLILPPLILNPLDTAMPLLLNCTMVAPDMLQLDLSEDLDSSRLDRQKVALGKGDRVLPARQLYMQDSAASRFYARFDSTPEAGEWTVEVEFQHFGTGRRRVDSCALVLSPKREATPARAVLSLDPDSSSTAVAWHARVQVQLPEPVRKTAAHTLNYRGADFEGVAACTLVTPFTLALTFPATTRGRGPLELTMPDGFIEWATGGTWPREDSSWSAAIGFPLEDSVGRFEIFGDITLLSSWPGSRLVARAVSSPRSAFWLPSVPEPPLTGALRAGDYRLFLLGDRDGNLHREAGWPNPYLPSEPLWELPDTLRVRARFTTELTLPSLK